MVTFHPTAAKLHNGQFRPMVMVRNALGQCVGSKVSAEYVFPTKEDAKNFARKAAHRVVNRYDFTRVA